MAMTIRESLKQAIVGLYASLASASSVYNYPGATQSQAIAEAAQAIKRRRTRVYFSDAGTAASGCAEFAFLFCPKDLSGGAQIVAVNLIIPIAVTASNTAYSTFTVSKRTSGGSQVSVAVQNTQITDPVLGANVVAWQPYQMTLSGTAANLLMAGAAGTDVLTLTIAKTGAGVALNTSARDFVVIEVEYEEL